MIKKLQFLFLAVFATTAISCSSDEESNNNFSSEDVLGTWYMTQYTYSGSSPYGNEEIYNSGEAIEFYDARFTFNEDGTFTTGGGYTIHLTIEYMGETEEQTSTISDFTSSGTYVVEDNIITITPEDGELVEYEIFSSSNTELSFGMENESFLQNGAILNIDSMIMKFTK